ncbi:chromosome segregation protein SMC [Oceanicella actignis]|uniref:chromosome segregation protein SMC n=1 Tax=Oceanicella actignis TaxID=1189325 RepID=UPI0011E7EF3E|nr:chromosome segregation protein SMC [Oceanicella actignis]TYO85452.1 condensin subunit Smc [Oceanicella actignis]
MQFVRLRLQGFKSFVDPTELVIAPGLTGVVGPNGCGKSNLLEALRWVMGESSARAMRGGAMEDVIFAGAASRPPRSFAEVSLLIDNAERRAPPGFNDSDTIEIVRRITREAGSAYKANGKEVRARDVRMMFADAATGAHSPALVRQGQISELINARPKARRAILEDAAGIGGLYQRRHEAELKLAAAEANLARVADVLEGLDQQLAQLARQARQAARYRELSQALRRAEALLLLQRWREADAERAAAEAALTEATRAAARAQAEAAARAAARIEAEQAPPPLREEDAVAGAVLQRLVVEREGLDEKIREAAAEVERLTARLRQLDADIARESALDSEAAQMTERLAREDEALARAEAGHPEALARAEEEARAAAQEAAARESALDAAAAAAAELEARCKTVRQRLEQARAGLERARKAHAEAEAGAAALETRAPALEQAAEAARAAAAEARAEAEAAEAGLAEAEKARAAAQGAEAETRAALSAAQGEARALEAEAAGLERALSRDAGPKGQALDALEVTPGYEAALGAALGEDLRAPLLEPGQPGAGWQALPPCDPPLAPLPEGVEPLAAQVKAPPALARRLAAVGVVKAEDGAALQAALRPGQRLVSAKGDLWRWDGYRAGAGQAPSAAAERLRQRNRLSELRQALTAAAAAQQDAAARHRAAAEAAAAAARAEAEARARRRQADQRQADAARALSRAEADLEAARGRLEALRAARDARAAELAAARAAADEAAAEAEGLGDVDEARARLAALRAELSRAREAQLAARAAADDLRRRGEGRARRRAQIAREAQDWTRRAQAAGARIAELTARRAEAAAALEAARAHPAALEARRHELVGAIARAEARAKAAADALAAAEEALRAAEQAERAAERAAAEAREARARLEARAEAAAERARAAAAQLEERLSMPHAKVAAHFELDPEDAPDPAAIEREIADLRRRRDALGAVNLRAEEDAREIRAERDSLAAERDDLLAAIARLRQGVAGLNAEGRARLLAAFEEVNRNFRTLFTHLFGGGRAELVLVESDDPLDAGLEIMCMPPGKKLSSLSLLSGGEQTLTALSLIFAVFLANPAPICVLDEVDAPLDDANVTRFCDLLDEMRRRTSTRFLIITHHAVTMSRMDRLFGVTMAEKGVSQLVSVDLTRAEALLEG